MFARTQHGAPEAIAQGEAKANMSREERTESGGKVHSFEGFSLETEKSPRERVDDRLPIVLSQESKWGVLGLVLVGVAIFPELLGMALWRRVLVGETDSPLLSMFFGTLSLITPLLVVMIGRLVRCETVVDRDGVTLRRHFGSRLIGTWTEPISNYEGVQFEFGFHISDSETMEIHKIMLIHPKERRCVELASLQRPCAQQLSVPTRPSGNLSEECEDYAQLLGLPVLEQIGGKDFRREPGDLDKSVWRLIQEGKVAVDPVVRTAPPWGLKLYVDGDTHVVTRPSDKGWCLTVAVFAATPLVICGFGIVGIVANLLSDPSPMTELEDLAGLLEAIYPGVKAGLWILFLLSFLAVWEGILLAGSWRELHSFRVEIHPNSIQFGYVAWGVICEEHKETLATACIESVNVTPEGIVVFMTVDGRMARTRPLGKKRGKWLCDYILATGAEWADAARDRREGEPLIG